MANTIDLLARFLEGTADSDEVIREARLVVARELKRLRRVSYNQGRPVGDGSDDRRAKWREYQRKYRAKKSRQIDIV
jgi:hypothetical protein